MPPSTEPSFASDGKWSLYLDKEDSFSPPSSERRPKAKSKAGSKANLKSSGARPKKTDGDSEKNDSDADTPQDGRGDPNLSGITPPLPVSLVEPQLVSYDTGFHVITAGIEVGITTIKGMADSRLACQGPSSQTFSTWKQAQSYYNVCFNDGSVIIRSALQDQTPVQSPVRKKRKVRTKPLEHESLSQPPFAPAFNTPKAKGSASQPINVSSAESTPESQSTRSYTPLFFPESPPVLSKPANSRKRPHAGAQAIPKTHNAASRIGKYPASAGVQAIPHIIPNVPSPSVQHPERVSRVRQYPKQSQPSPTPPPPYTSRSLSHIDPRNVFVESSSDDGDATDSNVNIAAANRPGPSSSLLVEAHSDAPTSYSRSSSVIEISDSEGESEIRSLGHIDPRNVYVESSSDDGDATDSNVNSAAANRPGPSSSLLVEAHSDAPTSYSRSSSVIEISDSEGESEIAWPHFIVRPDDDTIHELLMLFHPDNTDNQRQHPREYRRS